MTACALPRFMFTWVPSGNVRLTPESMSQDSDRGAGLSVAIGRNRLPESSDKGGIGSPMPSCRQSRRRFLASFTDSPLFSIHRFILPCLTLHLFRKEVRVAVGLWDSSFKNAFHTLSYRFAAVILVILYSRGKGKELKDAEQGCIADTLTYIHRATKLTSFFTPLLSPICVRLLSRFSCMRNPLVRVPLSIPKPSRDHPEGMAQAFGPSPERVGEAWYARHEHCLTGGSPE